MHSPASSGRVVIGAGEGQVGGFIMMHQQDLRRMAPLWLKYSEDVRFDPDVCAPPPPSLTHSHTHTHPSIACTCASARHGLSTVCQACGVLCLMAACRERAAGVRAAPFSTRQTARGPRKCSTDGGVSHRGLCAGRRGT